MKNKIGIAILGYGSIAKVHTLCYKEIAMFYPNSLPPIELVGVCTSNKESAHKAKEEGGFLHAYSSIDELLEHREIDVIDCSLPNYLRVETIKKCLSKGKHIYCEKPLANSLEEGRQIAQLVSNSDTKFGMTFNYRFIPAILRAKEMIESGDLGEVYHFNSKYYHTGYQNPNRPLTWRLTREGSGGGALVDMGAHIIDLMRYLVGEFASVSARTKTWIHDRPLPMDSTKSGKVDVDDAAWLQVEMKNGAIGTLESSRFATGTLDDLSFEIYARKGSLHFHLMDANWLYFFDESSPSGARGGKRGWTRIETVQSYPEASIPPARSKIGWTRSHAENQYQFLKSVIHDTEPSPSITDGLAVQEVLEASYNSASQSGKIITI